MGNCFSVEKKLYCQMCFGPFLHRSCLECGICNINFHYSCLYTKIKTLDKCLYCKENIYTRYLDVDNKY